MGRQSEQSSAREVSNEVSGRHDDCPHDERDAEQPKARRPGVVFLCRSGEGIEDRENLYQFMIRGVENALFFR